PELRCDVRHENGSVEACHPRSSSRPPVLKGGLPVLILRASGRTAAQIRPIFSGQRRDVLSSFGQTGPAGPSAAVIVIDDVPDRRERMFDKRRREFVTLLGGAATWPFAARAQQQAMSMIGFVSSRAPGESAGVVAAFRRGLSEAGFVEGQNLAIAFRWAEGHYDRLPALTAELVNLRVAVLFAAGGPPSAFAAKEATSTIPVVFSAVSDPVRLGLVPSLSRPGGNVTGMSLLNSELVAKCAQLLKEAVPTAAVIT